MADVAVARQYAKALIELASSPEEVERFVQDLRKAVTLVQAHDGMLLAALSHPSIDHTERRAVLDAVLPRVSPHPTVASFLRVVLEKRRMGLLGAMLEAFVAMADKVAGRVRAELVTARAASPELLAEVARALHASLGLEVVVTERVDTRLVGGLVVRVGDVVYDASVRTRLETLRLQLLTDGVPVGEA